MYNPDEECKAMIATIKRLCGQKSMTPHALAKKAGISTSTISYLVSGKTKPQVYTVLVLCNVLGVTMGELFDNKEVMPIENVVHTETSGSELRCMTCEEEKLLDCYRGLSDKKRELLKIFVDMLRQYNDGLIVEK